MTDITPLEEKDYGSLLKAVQRDSRARAFLVTASLLPSQVQALEKATSVPIIHSTPLAIDPRQILLSGPSSAIEAAAFFVASQGHTAIVVGDKSYHASGVRLLEDTLRVAQTALSAESLALGAKAGLNTRTIYDAISGAIGSCWSWVNQVPHMLEGNFVGDADDSIERSTRILSSFASEAKSLKVSTPLISIIRQHYISTASHGIIRESSSAIVKNYGVDVKAGGAKPEVTTVSQSQFEGKVGFVGLGSMGYGMASILHQAKFHVTGFDVWQPSVERFAASGASTASTAKEACAGAKVVVLMVVSAAQAEEVLFEGGVADAMAQEGVVLLMSTVPPSAAISMQNKLREVRPDLYLLDCPVSGGVGRAAQGDLTILCGGDDKGIDIASPVLKALSGTLGKDANLCIIPGGLGKGSAVKMVHQSLAGTQITLITEAMAFAARIGLPLGLTREVLLKSTATSGILNTRGKNMIDGLLKPNSTIDIWLKDLGIVVDEADTLGVPVYFSSYVLQINILGSSYGWGLQDDSSLTRLWKPAGIEVAQPGTST